MSFLNIFPRMSLSDPPPEPPAKKPAAASPPRTAPPQADAPPPQQPHSVPLLLRSVKDIPQEFGDRCLTLDQDGLSAEESTSLIAVSDAVRQGMALLQGSSGVLLVMSQPVTPGNLLALRDLRERASTRGCPVVAECQAVAGLLPLVYQHFADAGRRAAKGAAGMSEDSAAVRWFEDLVFQAGEAGASDIHVVIRRDAAEILFRVYGELEAVANWTSRQAAAMCAAAYTVLAEIRDTTWVPDRPQDANFAHAIRGRLHRIRYSHKPVYPEGVQVVMRILSTGKEFTFAPSLQALGYSDTQAETILAMVSEPSGVIVVSGETGSGKSTTLANLMNLLVSGCNGTISIQTVEDPPEYEVPGVIQSPVVHSREDQEKGISPYVRAIRSAMRCDPDILVIGEIRDLETARLAAAAAESGHPVMTTIHANRALGIVARMEGLGSTLPNNPVNRALLCAPGFIAGLVHQTLVPVLCPSCSVPFEDALAEGAVDRGLEARIRAVTGGGTDGIRFRGRGCHHCRGGIKGRTVCAEVIAPTPEILRLLLDRRDQEAFDAWLSGPDGFSIRDHAIEKMRAGLVSPADVESSLGRLRLESAGAKARMPPPVPHEPAASVVLLRQPAV